MSLKIPVCGRCQGRGVIRQYRLLDTPTEIYVLAADPRTANNPVHVATEEIYCECMGHLSGKQVIKQP